MNNHPDRVIFHVDMDAFYASVESLDDPSLRGKPIIVGGADFTRGVVSACSYEARSYGVHSAMPIQQARRLCPMGIYRPVRMSRYCELSELIMETLHEFTGHMHQVSIDEAFMDMTGTRLLFGPPIEAGRRIKDRICEITGGLTISIGIGSSYFIAKMASGCQKPNGLTFVETGNEQAFIAGFPLGKIWGIGEKGLASLNRKGITTVMQLRSFSLEALQKMFGNSTGQFYHHASRGIDPGIFQERSEARTISHEITFPLDILELEILRNTLFDLSHQVFTRLIRGKHATRTVVIKYRYGDFTTYTARCSQQHLIENSDRVFTLSWDLFLAKWNKRDPIRLLGVGLIVDNRAASSQQELFESQDSRKGRLERAIITNNTRPINAKRGTDRRTSDHGRVVKATSLISKNNRKHPTHPHELIDSEGDPL